MSTTNRRAGKRTDSRAERPSRTKDEERPTKKAAPTKKPSRSLERSPGKPGRSSTRSKTKLSDEKPARRDDRPGRRAERAEQRDEKPGRRSERPGRRDERSSRSDERPARRDRGTPSPTPPAAPKQLQPLELKDPVPQPKLRDRSTDEASGPSRAAFVAIVGRPNVGKSTLLNCLLGEKLAIVSPRPQTTRSRLLGIKNLPGAQLALVDTPGLHRAGGEGRTLLNRFMIEEAHAALGDVDLVLLVTDAITLRARPDKAGKPDSADKKSPLAADIVEPRIPPEDLVIADLVAASGRKVVVALNKIDQVGDKRAVLPVIAAWSAHPGITTVVPICAKTGDGVDELLDELCAVCPEGPPLFPQEQITDRSERYLVSEFVREQVFLQTRQELPYAVAVTIDEWQDRIAETGDREGERIGCAISATIHVEKPSQKKIVVGEGGQRIREIGATARREIAALIGCPLHLQLFVRVDLDWTATPNGLRKMGYHEGREGIGG